VEQAFHGLVDEKREAIRLVRAVMNEKDYSKFHDVTQSYLVHLCEDLAFDCQKIIQTCESVLARDQEFSEMAEGHNEHIIRETEAYFLKMAGDFSRYMSECSDVFNIHAAEKQVTEQAVKVIKKDEQSKQEFSNVYKERAKLGRKNTGIDVP
jgi:hypothetical protein